MCLIKRRRRRRHSLSRSLAHVQCLCLVVRVEISDDGPMISGARKRYELNEQLDVNCTAPRIRPDTLAAAHRLTWHLNNQTVWCHHLHLPLLLAQFRSRSRQCLD